MNCPQVLKELESCGTAQNRKVYGRHGVGPNQYGVSFANLKRLAKAIKTDHELAQELWASGNHDARILATYVADPARLSLRDLDAWARELDNYVLTDALAGLVGKSPFARKKMEKWCRARSEWMGRAGYVLLAHLAMQDRELDDAWFAQHLAVIEKEIHTRKNRVRDAMNMALIAIGVRNGRLRKKALAAAARIGKIEVDHGETGCKTPDAAEYIERTLARRRNKR